MEYQNAGKILPQELLRQIQQYFQGGSLYIPKSGSLFTPDRRTDYQAELDNRNRHIYHKHLQGWTSGRLAEHYSLSPSSIRRILQNQRKEAQAMDTIISEIQATDDLDEPGTCSMILIEGEI